MKKLVVLSHGIARFDVLWNPAARLLGRYVTMGKFLNRWHYFRNIKTYLEANDCVVYHTDVPFAKTVKQRAEALRKQLCQIAESTRQIDVVIGHSMGGLDARWAIGALGANKFVKKLCTIGTPHFGTSLADWGMEHRGDALLKALHSFIDLDGFEDLTRSACVALNHDLEVTEATNLVEYHAYAAHEDLARVFTPIRESWKIIRAREGDNDGLVSVPSQLWYATLNCRDILRPNVRPIRKEVSQHVVPFPLDHFNECGWWDRHEPEKREAFECHVKDLYLEIANS